MLVGRDQEQFVIDGLLERARAGHSGVLAIGGEPGMGKSTLIGYAEQQARDMVVLRARGIQSEARIPFAALFELLRPALGCLDRIPRPQATALEGALALRPPRSEDRFAVGAATLSLLAALAETAPLLVMVDDAHWIDGSTANALLFAIRRLVADPIAVVLSVREGEPSLLDGADLPYRRLEGLDRTGAASLLGRRAARPVPRDVVDRLHRQTGGNPLALVEIAGELERFRHDAPLDTPLPVVTSVANVYLNRVRALPPAARDVLLLAAASDTGDLPTLVRAARPLGLDLADLAVAEGTGLVSLGDGRVEFRHPLIRSAIYGDAAPDRRRIFHRALAGALPDADLDRRAWHLALAVVGPDDTACSALEQAGVRARERSAYDVSSRAYERAAQLAPDEARRGRLLHAAADAAWLGGLPSRAVALLDEARQHATTPGLMVAIEHLRGHIAIRLGPVSQGQAILSLAAEQAVAVDAERAVEMLAEVLSAAFYAGDAPGMRTTAARIAALAPTVGTTRAAFFATITSGMALTFSGEPEGGAALLRQAIAIAEGSQELTEDPRLLTTWAAMGPLWLREAHAGRALIGRALEMARRRTAIGVLPYLLSHIAIDQATSDRWAEAGAGFHEVIALAREAQQRTDLAAGLARLAWLEARQGREEQCRAHAAEALAVAGQLGLGVCQVWAMAALGDLELGLGRSKAAIACFGDLNAVLRERGIGDVDLSPAPELVELHLRVGQPEHAATIAATYEREAAAKGQPWALARAARCRGLLAPADDIDDHFALALDRHALTPDVFETARTQLAYGSRLRRGRHRVQARQHLRAAIDTFDRLGADPWSDVARAELSATGETARQRTPATRDQLTPQELQIGLLLAAGRTTRDAASTLFLSPKTVEYHLRSVYRKLGIASREELTAAMAATEPGAITAPSVPAGDSA